MHRVAPVFLAALLLSASGCATETTTILVVRHAEKILNAGDDPHLSDAGNARAQELAKVAENAHIRSVYVTQYQRTKETAAPFLAAHSDIAVRAVPVNISGVKNYPKELASTILSADRGRTVLVVSHSNIVPALVQELAHVKVPDIPDNEFSRLYIIIVRRGQPPALIAARYGAP